MRIFRKFSPRLKGVETVTTVIGAVLIAAITVFFFYYMFPLFFGDLFQSIALSSSEIVARDMAGFISVSAVAPNQIQIEYSPSSSTQYNVSIANRVVNVILSAGKTTNNEIASSKIAVGNLTQQIINENSFEISKNVKILTDQSGNKISQPVYSVIGTSNLGVK